MPESHHNAISVISSVGPGIARAGMAAGDLGAHSAVHAEHYFLYDYDAVLLPAWLESGTYLGRI